MSELKTKPCPECKKGEAIELVKESVRLGWHCVSCGYWDKATGRERLVKTDRRPA